MPQEVEARVKEIIPRTYNVKSFRFDVGQVVTFKAGQFLCATLKTEASCKRYLSISNSPTETGYIEFTKKITNSDFSKALEALKIGDVLYINYPSGNFILKDPKEKAAFLSGGIGITPIRSICKYVVDTNLGTDMVLLYANRTIGDIVFKEDFEVMQRDYPRLRVCHVLSEPAPGFKCAHGRIDSGLI
ncbi:MAG: FAD-dependent oxidoreductase, partial [Candidatus Omnitrophica bacterium]|nr:FAD-dependent oxidoreductase [Candidatus Omnitrophota bacterium]